MGDPDRAPARARSPAAGAPDDGAPGDAALLAYAREHAVGWFPELPASVPVEATIEQSIRRRRSALSVVRLSAPSWEKLVVAKRVLEPRATPAAPLPPTAIAPQLVPPPAPADLPGLQHRGLALTHHHFTALGDERFGTIRPIDFLPDERLLIMEHVVHPTLKDGLRRATRFAPSAARASVGRSMERAGAWLSEYHGLDPGDVAPVPTIRPGRDELVAGVRTIADHMSAGTRDDRLFRNVHDSVGEWAEAHLPDRLPVGLSHGDFAPRNVFVTSSGRVIGFDSLPRFFAPRQHDIARFLVSLRTGSLQVLSLGLAHSERQLDAFEGRFLDGYGRDSLSRPGIRLFEILVLMVRWSVLREGEAMARIRASDAHHRRRIATRGRLHPRSYRHEIVRHVSLLEAGRAG